MSHPWASGWVKYGVENVASTTTGIPCAFAIAETLSRSVISRAGFETVSQNSARVLSSMAFAKASGSFESTNLTLMPSFGRMSLNCV